MFASVKHPRTRRIGVFAAALAGLSIVLAACDDPAFAVPREGAPEQLVFSLSSYEVGGTHVELRGDTVVFRRGTWSGGLVDSVSVVPTAEQWRAFWAAADEAGVSRWRRRYLAEGIMDGAGWGLRIRAAGGSIVSEGSNAYPDRLGREHENESTPEFQALMDALGDLVGRPIW